MITSRHVSELLDAPPVWETQTPPTPHIVQFSRIQVVRNLDTHLFPNRAERDELRDIRDSIQTATHAVSDFSNGWALNAARISTAEEDLLKQSAYIASGWRNVTCGGVIISTIRDAVVQINKGDHLTLSVFRPSLAFTEALHSADQIISDLSNYLLFARNGQIGYLTSHLCDAGPAIRATVSMHLPALRMTTRIRPIIRGLEAMGFSVLNSMEDQGHIEDDVIRITRNSSHGESPEHIAAAVEKQAEMIIKFEMDCRQQLLEQTPDDLFDRVSRSYSILRSAYKLSQVDVQRFVSALRLGIDCGMFRQLDHTILNSIVNGTSEYKLQQKSTTTLKRREVETERARFVKRTLNLLR